MRKWIFKEDKLVWSKNKMFSILSSNKNENENENFLFSQQNK